MFCKHTVLMLAAALAATLLIAPLARAQNGYPTKPVRLIVAFPPGQAPDIVARLLADELTKTWGKQAIVDNRAGDASVGAGPARTAGRDEIRARRAREVDRRCTPCEREGGL